MKFLPRVLVAPPRLLARGTDRLLRNMLLLFSSLRRADRIDDNYLQLANEIDRLLRNKVLAVWYPRCIDQIYGGFKPIWPTRGETEKFVVFQARMAWIAATVAGYATDLQAEYLDYARHGLEFLNRVMHDKQFGGYYWKVDLTGDFTERFGDDKHVYGIAFVIHAASETTRQTKDDCALQMAIEAYRWLEHHAADRQHGGYCEWLRRDGSPIPPPPKPYRKWRFYRLGTLVGYKSMNSHLHLLGAYTALYRVWPDEGLRKRLEQLLSILRDRIAVEPGALNLYFTPDWRPLPAHDSFGHDVEAAYFLAAAVEALGQPDDQTTWRVARQLVDHALIWGWDERYGGFYHKGEIFSGTHDMRKFGWVQAESLNALLLMHERFGQETNDYFEAFIKLWQFIRTHQINHRHGDWHRILTRNGRTLPHDNTVQESGTVNHYAHGMMNVMRGLRNLAGRE